MKITKRELCCLPIAKDKESKQCATLSEQYIDVCDCRTAIRLPLVDAPIIPAENQGTLNLSTNVLDRLNKTMLPHDVVTVYHDESTHSVVLQDTTGQTTTIPDDIAISKEEVIPSDMIQSFYSSEQWCETDHMVTFSIKRLMDLLNIIKKYDDKDSYISMMFDTRSDSTPIRWESRDGAKGVFMPINRNVADIEAGK